MFVKKPDLEDLLGQALEHKQLRPIIEEKGYNETKRDIKGYLQDAYNEHKHLLTSATLSDRVDKLLAPVGLFSDYTKLAGGFGYGIGTVKELIEAVPKIYHNIQYLRKTKRWWDVIENAGLEFLSWFVPGGSTIDLLNHYINQSSRYIVDEGVHRFIEQRYLTKDKSPAKIVDMVGYNGSLAKRQREKNTKKRNVGGLGSPVGALA
tara:strand:+ start:1093 stop:1710 length:618 start_codon:yes stop_codon:yes gene_type:complete